MICILSSQKIYFMLKVFTFSSLYSFIVSIGLSHDRFERNGCVSLDLKTLYVRLSFRGDGLVCRSFCKFLLSFLFF